MLSFPLLLAVLLQLQPMQMIREDNDRAGVNTHPYEFRTMPVTTQRQARITTMVYLQRARSRATMLRRQPSQTHIRQILQHLTDRLT